MPDNPYESPQEKLERQGILRRIRAWQVSLALILIGIGGYLGCFAIVAAIATATTRRQLEQPLLVTVVIILAFTETTSWV